MSKFDKEFKSVNDVKKNKNRGHVIPENRLQLVEPQYTKWWTLPLRS